MSKKKAIMDVKASDIMPPKQVSQAEENTKQYWIGVLPGCPKRNVALGGTSFNTKTGDYNGAGGNPGATMMLSDTQVSRIKRSLRTRVCSDDAPAPNIYDIGMKFYRAKPQHVPLANYVYMIPIEEAHQIVGAADWRNGTPPSMAELAKRVEDKGTYFIKVLAPSESADPEAARLAAANESLEKEIAELKAKLSSEDGAGSDDNEDDDLAARAKQLEDDFTVPQLKKHCKDNGIDLPKKANKGVIIEAILALEFDGDNSGE